MKNIKILTLIILSIIGIILIINFLGYRSNIANGITGDKIKKIQIGMPFEQVISILGRPYEIKSLAGLHDFSCKNPKPRLEMNVIESTDIISIVDSIYNDTNYCCDGNEEDVLRGKEVALTYTKKYTSPIRFFIYYPMLWVHLDSNYCVRSVYAKRYDWFDSICIYSLLSADGIGFINEELFNKCFKK